MKLTPQALQQLIKEELEVILTDDEAAELFGDRLKEMLMEITDAEWRAMQAASIKPGSLTPPPEWAIDQWHRTPDGVRFGAPQLSTATEAEKHAYIIQKRAEREAAERNLGRTPISAAEERANKMRRFRNIRAKAWDAEKKAAADRLNQAVLSGADVRPPKASRAKAYAAAKAEFKDLMARDAAREVARKEWVRSFEAPAAEALETDLLGSSAEMRAARDKARSASRIASDVPRPGRPSWSPAPETLDPRLRYLRPETNLDPETLRRLRGRFEKPGSFIGKPAYASPEVARIQAMVPGEARREALKAAAAQAAAQRQAKRAAAKAILKKYGAGALTGADLAFAIEGGYLGGKASQAPLSRPSPLRKKMGLAGGIPLVQDAPEYIKSGEGFVDDPRSPDWDPDEMVKNAGGWGITDIDPSAPITKHVASRLRGQPEATPAKRMVGGEHVPASQDPEYLAKRQAQRDAGMRAGGYDPDNPASLEKANWDLANYVARESLTPANLRRMVMEELGFGEGKPADDEWSKKKEYVVEEDSQLELPGMETPALCEPADGVDDLSSQLAQMVVDSGMPPEELNDLMELIYDKVAADLEGIGIEDEEDSDDYRRTTIGFMEALRKATIKKINEGWRDLPKLRNLRRLGFLDQGMAGRKFLKTEITQDPQVAAKEAASEEAQSAAQSANTGTPQASGEQAGHTQAQAALSSAAKKGGDIITGGEESATVATGQKDLDEQEELNRWSTLAGIEAVEEKKQPSEKSAKKAHKALAKTAKKKFPGDEERQDRYIYGGKRNIGWKPKRERQ